MIVHLNQPPRPTNATLLKESRLELLLYEQIEQAGLCRPFWQRKVNGHKVDFCWPAHRIIVEVQGGTRGLGRHSREPGYSTDRLFSNQCQLEGWIVLEFTSEQVQDGSALAVIREALEANR